MDVHLQKQFKILNTYNAYTQPSPTQPVLTGQSRPHIKQPKGGIGINTKLSQQYQPSNDLNCVDARCNITPTEPQLGPEYPQHVALINLLEGI